MNTSLNLQSYIHLGKRLLPAQKTSQQLGTGLFGAASNLPQMLPPRVAAAKAEISELT